jgi:hypothetical protein
MSGQKMTPEEMERLLAALDEHKARAVAAAVYKTEIKRRDAALRADYKAHGLRRITPGAIVQFVEAETVESQP